MQKLSCSGKVEVIDSTLRFLTSLAMDSLNQYGRMRTVVSIIPLSFIFPLGHTINKQIDKLFGLELYPQNSWPTHLSNTYVLCAGSQGERNSGNLLDNLSSICWKKKKRKKKNHYSIGRWQRKILKFSSVLYLFIPIHDTYAKIYIHPVFI